MSASAHVLDKHVEPLRCHRLGRGEAGVALRHHVSYAAGFKRFFEYICVYVCMRIVPTHRGKLGPHPGNPGPRNMRVVLLPLLDGSGGAGSSPFWLCCAYPRKVWGESCMGLCTRGPGGSGKIGISTHREDGETCIGDIGRMRRRNGRMGGMGDMQEGRMDDLDCMEESPGTEDFGTTNGAEEGAVAAAGEEIGTDRSTEGKDEKDFGKRRVKIADRSIKEEVLQRLERESDQDESAYRYETDREATATQTERNGSARMCHKDIRAEHGGSAKHDKRRSRHDRRFVEDGVEFAELESWRSSDCRSKTEHSQMQLAEKYGCPICPYLHREDRMKMKFMEADEWREFPHVAGVERRATQGRDCITEDRQVVRKKFFLSVENKQMDVTCGIVVTSEECWRMEMAQECIADGRMTHGRDGEVHMEMAHGCIVNGRMAHRSDGEAHRHMSRAHRYMAHGRMDGTHEHVGVAHDRNASWNTAATHWSMSHGRCGKREATTAWIVEIASIGVGVENVRWRSGYGVALEHAPIRVGNGRPLEAPETQSQEETYTEADVIGCNTARGDAKEEEETRQQNEKDMTETCAETCSGCRDRQNHGKDMIETCMETCDGCRDRQSHGKDMTETCAETCNGCRDRQSHGKDMIETCGETCKGPWKETCEIETNEETCREHGDRQETCGKTHRRETCGETCRKHGDWQETCRKTHRQQTCGEETCNRQGTRGENRREKGDAHKTCGKGGYWCETCRREKGDWHKTCGKG